MKSKLKSKQNKYKLELTSEELDRVLMVIKRDADDDVQWINSSDRDDKSFYKKSLTVNKNIIEKIFSAYTK